MMPTRHAGTVISCVLAAMLAGCGLNRQQAHTHWREWSPDILEIEWPLRDVSALQPSGRGWRVEVPTAVDGQVITLDMVQSLQPYGNGWILATMLKESPSQRTPSLFGDQSFSFACWPPGMPREVATEAAGMDGDAELMKAAPYQQEFRYTRPEAEPIGLVIHAFGLGDPEHELPVSRALSSRGWAVLYTTRLGAYAQMDPAMLEGQDPAGAARMYDSFVEEFIASYAYAGEAAVEFLREHDAELRGKPIIVAGFSFGAMMAPTLAARLGNDVAAVVLVGGGADVPAIARETTVRLPWSEPQATMRKLSAALYRKLRNEYRTRTRLDPYATAALLRARPVLVVHAAWDRIVPARYGDMLWERLGRPERWVIGGGHMWLFWRLPAYAEEIAAWAHESALEYWSERPGKPNDVSGAMPQIP